MIKQQSVRPKIIAAGALALALLLVPSAKSDVWNKKTFVTFHEPVEFPGGVVVPSGNYVMKLFDSLSNRHVVQVFNPEQNRIYATVLANAAYRLKPVEKTLITYHETPKGDPAFIDEWFYPGDTVGQQFPYPKDRMRRISQSMEGPAPLFAVQLTPPAVAVEEARSAALDLTTHADEPAEPEPVLLAQDTPPGEPTPSRADSNMDDSSTLPQTASALPYLGLGGVMLLSWAFILRAARSVGRKSES